MSVYRPASLVNFGCLHPVTTVCADGSTRVVPCRNCAYCKLHHADVQSLFCSYELASCNYNLFVTTTYANNYLPTAHFSYHGNICHLCTTDGELLPYQWHDKKTIAFVKNLSLNYASKFPRFFSFGQIPVLEVSHIQTFLKVLRQRLYRKFGSYKLFRYFWCGEYGETTFRPHFHLLLFCQSEQVRAYIKTIVPTCWHYGHTVSRYYVGDTASYLASYAVGLTAGFTVFSRGRYKSLARHSKGLGNGFLQNQQSTFYQQFSRGNFSNASCVLGSKQQILIPTHSITRTIYPKCRAFGLCNTELRLKRYLLAFGQSCRPTEYAKKLTQEILDYESCSFAQYPKYYYCFPHIPKATNFDKVYTRVYSDVLISYKFISAARLYSHNCYRYHLFKIETLLGLGVMRSFLKDLKDFTSLADFPEAQCYFLYDKSNPFKTFDNYAKSEPFKAWYSYCTSRLIDCSKSKKQKEPFTLKSYFND